MTPPPEIQRLLDAYVAATGLPVRMTYERERALSELHQRGITEADITAICRELKRLIAGHDKGYGPSSLDFGNAVGNVDRTEERALRLRQRARRNPSALKTAPRTTITGEGTVNVIDFPSPETSVPMAQFQEGMEALKRSIKRA